MVASVPVSIHGPADGGRAMPRDAWERLLAGSPRLEALYQSPCWLEQLPETSGAPAWELFLLGERADAPRGLAPLRRGHFRLRFDIAARALWEARLDTVHLLGSEPLMEEDGTLLDTLIDAVWKRYPEAQCLYMDSVEVGGFVWRHLHDHGAAANDRLLYVPEGRRPHHVIDLPASFQDYLASQFSAKTRNTLRRKARQLEAAGPVRLERIEQAAGVPGFLAAATAVSLQSWQHRVLGPRIRNEPVQQARLSRLAEQGVLRCYVLHCGEAPCAFVLGYQYHGVFQYAEVAYDQRYGRRKLSPSIVLLYRLVEDLISHRPARCLNFGVGDADYKRLFANRRYLDARLLLLRRNWRNRLLRGAHREFRAAVVGVRGLLARHGARGGARPASPAAAHRWTAHGD